MRFGLNKYKGIFNEASWIMGSNLVGAIFSSAFVFFSAYKLGIKNYGEIAVISSIVLLVQDLLSFRTWEVIVNLGYDKKDKKLDLYKLYSSFLVLDLITLSLSTVLIILGGITYAELFSTVNAEFINNLFLYSLVGLLIFNKNSSIAIMRVLKNYKHIAVVNITSNFLKLILAVVILYIYPQIKGYMLVLILTSISSLFCYFYFVNKYFNMSLNEMRKYRPRISDMYTLFIENKSLIFTSYWVSTLKSLNTRLLVIIMSLWFSRETIGAFKFTRDILLVFNLAVTDPLYNMIYPRFSKAKSLKNISNIKKIIKYSILVSLVITGSYYVLIKYVGSFIILNYFKDYSLSISLLQLMSLEILLYMQFSWITPYLMINGINKENIVSRIINILSTIVLIFITKTNFTYFSIQISIIFGMVIQLCYLAMKIKKKRW